MKLREVLGSHLIMGLQGPSLTEDEKKFLVQENIAGVILFTRNVKSPQQVYELCSEIQSLSRLTAAKTPFFISVDMEGGRVARMREPFTVWPPMRKLGDLDSPNATYNFALAMGEELRSVGVNLDFAPCLDIFNNPKNTVIGDRAFGENPEIVARHASAAIRGFLKAEIIPCGKHFPGHGMTVIDSHEDLPVEEADLARLGRIELIPFQRAFKSGLDLVMSAHIMFPKIDPQWPATLSEIFLKDILRRQLRYQGLVITDDMDMKALAKHYDRSFLPVRALQAGADLILYCNEPESPPRALEGLEKALKDGELRLSDLEVSMKRIQDFKVKHLKSAAHLGPRIEDPWESPTSHRALARAIKEGHLPEGL